jgi:hypothetical protein
MKKLLILCAAAILASCTHDVDLIDQKEREEIFENNFNSTFGVSESSYANHDWGMKSMPLVDITNNATARRAMTRGVDVNGNLWYQNWYRPTNVTADEIAWAKQEFGKVRRDTKPWISVEWSNYWVQQVYKGEQSYIDGFNQNIGLGSDHMDHLKVFNNKKKEVISWWPYQESIVTYEGDYEHINNFNSGNNNTTYNDDVTHEQFIGTTLMTDMGTDGRAEQFAYYNSTDSKYHYEYIVLEHNGSYYVGFDFYAHGTDIYPYNQNMDVERDYIYNDWIIKITPARSINDAPSVERVRVMCEDLSTSRTDFDYNDVVFDIKFFKNGNNYTADIILRAIGGELPLYIGTREVHSLFNVSTGTMVNTYEGRHTEIDPVHFTVELPSGTYNNAFDAINALPVFVKISSSPTPIQLTVNPGKPAEMICVPVTTEWPNERESILNRYPSFVNWITNPDVTWYE